MSATTISVFIDDADEAGLNSVSGGFFGGLLIALPVSALVWAPIAWVAVAFLR